SLRYKRGGQNAPLPAALQECSESRAFLECFRIPRTMDRDVGCRTLDLAEIVGRQPERCRGDVLLEPRQLRGAGNRRDPGLEREQPGERDLCRRRPLLFGDRAEYVHDGFIGLASVRGEPWHDVAEVRLYERRLLVDRAGQKALAQR